MADQTPAAAPAEKPASEFNEFSFDSADGFNFDFSGGFTDESPFADGGESNPFGVSADGAEFGAEGSDFASTPSAEPAEGTPAATEPAAEEEDEDPNAGHLDANLDPEEDTVWSNRGKLYRLDKAESCWKERGTGLIKVLKHKERGTYRIVMRRDKILTLCANHSITAALDIKKNQGNACLWSVRDFTDDPKNGNLEVLSMKFEAEEIANQFAEKIFLL